ncbi:AAA family ATPase [Neorhizobium galegae]|uniref:ATP-dependent nuclease n=1 Tax=Neorhizobium galegae TaxID=399 RepID=UPI0021022459|nr:AAA family ATPase [Neorhizobium galegae]MCQ1779422.1 AAA family ATPase [Neorhizobium galegae]MCQ1795582.1 AAA family ATPase [Neorhizobium galegae]
MVEDVVEFERGKLRSLSVRNFRCIGPNAVKVDLDDIVVLVGPNNSGKSSILRAYEIAVSEGSKPGNLRQEDFPNGQINPDEPTEIELVTEVVHGDPGKHWIGDLDGRPIAGGGRKYVKEKWVWNGIGKGTRYGWNVEKQGWDDKKPWGYANVANARRPAVHPVRAFDPPEAQAKQIHDLLSKAIVGSAKALERDGVNLYDKLLSDVTEFQKLALDQNKEKIEQAEKMLNEIVSSIFLDHAVRYVQSTDASDTSLKLFPDGGKLTMGHRDGHMSDLESQGSGARRTMLWATLKLLKDSAADQKRANVLLIDEPELCLHPSAIRDACRVLYDLASKEGWQVMITTHSPVFIDLSRDNTSIVRVERREKGEIVGTTLYRPENAKLDDRDKQNLKLLNIYDPYVAEFFFGGRVILVEGDTEYSAFRIIMEGDRSLSDVHVIRARGKATIASLAKILNQFGARYSILHDTDVPKTFRKNPKTGIKEEIANPAWTTNNNILEAVAHQLKAKRVRLVASKVHFEAAFFGTALTGEKPYTAVRTLATDADRRRVVSQLLAGLVDHDAPLPANSIEWEEIADLEAALVV